MADSLFQGAIVADAPFAFAGLLRAEGFGGALSLEEASPAVIRAVELGRFCLASAVRFAAGALGGGEAAGEQRARDVESDLFLLACVLMYLCVRTHARTFGLKITR